ncbi:putative capsid protein [Avon-Heathcote Estuary associated circular virus 25]|uniref:Capsid protein n=1 Tax=Avon-Heathcote Estuary associated circular virus 25 TaxID=1618249 RepID=A0A0C5IML3_9VIRU|nr:putative capsid protein [Avon-Heathcote Estuary associated circular virus 25]AJP36464.1 putative capsid protein [Avon-Heathcote Estuary associated circular virus 25]AJP36467.1 putative capsid protein [Avon-Heathcote Estuary associated circular virus 25]QUS52499.1 capsid protein [Avon-Heathcote Estuary associated circular virus 25]
MSYNGRRRVARSSRYNARRYSPYSPYSLRSAVRVGRYLGNYARKSFNNWRSKTSAKKQRRSIGNKIISASNGIGYSNFRENRKCYPNVRNMLKAGTLSVYKYVDTKRLEWDAGSQGVLNVATTFGVQQIQNVMNNIGASANGDDTTRMVVKGVTGSVNISNMSNANVLITLYDVVARTDSNTSSAWANPLNAWGNGLEDSEEGGSVAAGRNNIGATPFQSVMFCRKYRVMKVTKIYMEAGRSHIHYIKRNMNSVLNNSIMETNETNLANKTHYCFAVARGFPVNDATTDTNIALGSGALDFVFTETYQQVWPQYALKRYYYNDQQQAITSEKLMNAETGEGDVYEEV